MFSVWSEITCEKSCVVLVIIGKQQDTGTVLMLLHLLVADLTGKGSEYLF